MTDSLKRKWCKVGLLALLSVLAFSWGQRRAAAVGNDEAPDRRAEVATVVIHAIGGPMCRDGQVVFSGAPGDAKRWKKWFERQPSLSIHYIIDRDGNIEQGITEGKVAWHARGRNKDSIGIELLNNGDGVEPYPQKQLSALTTLVKQIMDRHKAVSVDRVLRHSDIDKRTFECAGQRLPLKQDPGAKFPYRDFIFGLKPVSAYRLFQ